MHPLGSGGRPSVMNFLQAKAFSFYPGACGRKGLEKYGEMLVCSPLFMPV